MTKYWAVAEGLVDRDEPHFVGPFETEDQARDGRDHLSVAHRHLQQRDSDFAFYVVQRPLGWQP